MHIVSVNEGKATVFCWFCKQVISLGTPSQGASNFKVHSSCNKHQARITDYFGADVPYETAANIVFGGLDSNIYALNDGLISCTQCVKDFAKNASFRNYNTTYASMEAQIPINENVR